MMPIEAAAAAVMMCRQVEHGFRPPMVWRWPFAGRNEEAATARRFVRFLLHGFPGVDDVEQVAGELIANALTHTRSGAPGGRFVVEVRRWPDSVALTVLDLGGPNDPRPGDGAVAENGYGLLTVRALAAWWGWHGDARGRAVTAIFTRR